MKNKKGFTLIELLAVIVILAIIALIATPIVLNTITKAKKNAAIDSAYGYIEAIEYQNQMNALDEKKYEKIESGDVSILNSKVKVKGRKPDSGNVIVVDGLVAASTLCINGYKTVYDNGKVTVASDSSECRSSDSNNESNGNSDESCNIDLHANPKNLNVWLKDVTGGQELCIKANGQDECFKYNDYENETSHMETVIGNCTTNPMGPGQSITVCDGEDYTCYTKSTNEVYCIAHLRYAPHCTLASNTNSCEVDKPWMYRIQDEYDSNENHTILNENEYHNVRTVEKSDGTKGVCIKYITNNWECFYADDYEAAKTKMASVFAQHDDTNDPYPTECFEQELEWDNNRTIYSCSIWIPYGNNSVTEYGCSMYKTDDGGVEELGCFSPAMPDLRGCRLDIQAYGDEEGNNWYAYCDNASEEYERATLNKCE